MSSWLRRLVLSLGFRVLRVVWFFTRPITVGVRILLLQDGKVMLVRHSYQAGWFLPGGGVKRGEILAEAVRREAAEECGAYIDTMELWGIYSHTNVYKNDHVAVFVSEDFHLEQQKAAEISEAAFFRLDSLPSDLSESTRSGIEGYLKGERYNRT